MTPTRARPAGKRRPGVLFQATKTGGACARRLRLRTISAKLAAGGGSWTRIGVTASLDAREITSAKVCSSATGSSKKCPAGTDTCSGTGTLNASQHCVDCGPAGACPGTSSWQQAWATLAGRSSDAIAQWLDASNHAHATSRETSATAQRLLRSDVTRALINPPARIGKGGSHCTAFQSVAVAASGNHEASRADPW